MHVLKQFILEGLHEQESTRLSRLCINALKDFITQSEKIVPNVTRSVKFNTLVGQQGELFLNVTFISDDNPRNLGFVDGSQEETWDGTSLVEIDVAIPHRWVTTGEWRKGMVGIVTQVKGTIRHELEHVHQQSQKRVPAELVDINRGSDGMSSLKNWIEYALQPHEIEAWTAAIYKKAKMTGTDMGTAIQKSSDNRFKGLKDVSYDVGNEMMAPVRAAWTAYAKKRFSRARM